MDVDAIPQQVQPAPKKRPKSGTEVVGQVRRALLDAMYSDGQQKRFLKRQVVESLLGVLSAARVAGLDWEEMAKICADHGFEISPNTLKSYYVDLKEERESQKIRSQANSIIRDKKKIDLKREIQEGTADKLDARRRAQQRLAAKPKLMSPERLRALEEANSASGSKPANTSPATSESGTSKVSSPAARTAPPAQRKPLVEQSLPPKEPDPPGASIGDEPSAFPELKAGQGKTIEQLEAESKNVETATEIAEHLTLRNGRAYYESGAPFVDVLSPRQVGFLKRHGKYIANAMPESRSGSSVVKMKNNL